MTPQHPVSWQPSQDGTRMIGHMILNKCIKGEVGPTFSAAILGLKVGGGQILESGKIGALIEKVKKGSIADTVGHLRPGKAPLPPFVFLSFPFFFSVTACDMKGASKGNGCYTQLLFLLTWICAFLITTDVSQNEWCHFR